MTSFETDQKIVNCAVILFLIGLSFLCGACVQACYHLVTSSNYSMHPNNTPIICGYHNETNENIDNETIDFYKLFND